MNTIDDYLIELGACYDAKQFCKGKSWEEIYATCPRGDWFLWLYKRTMSISEEDFRRLTLAKGHCAHTVIHLMKDKRSIDAVTAAIRFGNGEITRDQLRNAAAAAYAAADADAAAAAAAAAAYAADADAAAAAAAAAAAYARTENRLKTADICRLYFPIEIWNIKIDK